MNGHQTPRPPAGPRRVPTRSRRTVAPTALLVAALVALLLAASLVVAGCGGKTAATTTAAPTTTLAPTTTAAPSTPAAPDTTAAPDTSSTLAEGTFPATVTDDNKNSVTINAKPMKIVSTAPANTETLFALGVGSRVVGVTSLDDYPPEVKNIAKIGDFQANTEAIMALSPDLVVGYSGNEEALAPVQKAGTPVLIMNPTTLDGIYANITTIGAATGATGAAAALIDVMKQDIKGIADKAAAATSKPTVFYAVDNTLWTVGPGSFVDELLNLLGVTNVADTPAGGAAAKSYYQFSAEQLVAADPDVILLPGSVYKSAQEFTSDPRFAGMKAVKNGTVKVIDDVLVTRPGPRIAQGLQIVADALGVK